MALNPNFPADPHVILDPSIRWYPGDELLAELGYEKLLPPLVHKVRRGVKRWRENGYAGASNTTWALLNHWFQAEHLLPQADGTVRSFQWYFAQREAVESAIWLYEVEQARDPYALMKYDSSGRVSKGMFDEDWTRYVLKMATGAGKTKVMSLLMAWCYFHRRYEQGSNLSTNFLLIAPNIIVLDRLRVDFDGAKIFLKIRSFRPMDMKARIGLRISSSPYTSRMRSGWCPIPAISSSATSTASMKATARPPSRMRTQPTISLAKSPLGKRLAARSI